MNTSKNILNNITFQKFFSIVLLTVLLIFFSSCKKEKNDKQPEPSDNLALDSIVATKKNIIAWEQIIIKAYTRGNNISYKWKTNHGTMLTTDSSAVTYWACTSCIGLNTIECKISNEYGTISDTIMVNVTQ